MKKIFLGIVILLSFESVGIVNADTLIDIDNHWAKKSIDRLVESDSINGYEDNSFRPDNPISVAEFLKILVQYSDYKKILVGERWPDWYINTAKYYQLVYDDEFDNYDRSITRNEVAKILARFIRVDDIKKSNKKFKDTTDTTVLKLKNLGVINGYSDDTFRGENAISRAEASAVICRAMKVRRELVAKRTYSIKDAENLTNIGRNPSYMSDFQNRFEIKNNKLYFFDNGRYGKMDGATFDDKNIENKKIVQLIDSLIQEDAYVAVNYIPDKLLYDQIVVDYGRREGYVYNNAFTFSFIFYPDRQFELRKSSLNDSLSEECFMKIVVAKMWKDAYDLKNGEYAHEQNNQKLLKALYTSFDKREAKGIYEFIQEWIPKLYEAEIGSKFVEVKKIGKYTINLYTTGNNRVQLYVSK